MAKGNTYAADILKLIFQAVTIADLAENDTTSPATTLTVALHTSDPGAGGTQSTNETAYTNYVRVAVNRNSGGWGITNQTINPVAAIDFAACGATPGGPITHFSVGTGVSNKMLYSGTVTPNITMAEAVIPRLTTATAITES